MTFSRLNTSTLTAMTVAIVGALSLSAPAFAGDANSPLMMLNTIVTQATGQAAQAPQVQNTAIPGIMTDAHMAAAEAQVLSTLSPRERAAYLARKNSVKSNNVTALTNALNAQQAVAPQVQAAPQNGLGQILGAVAGQALQNQNVGGAATANTAQAQAIAAEAQAIANMTPQQRTEYLARKHGGQGLGNAMALTNALGNQAAAPQGAQPTAQQLPSPAALFGGLLGAATGSTTATQNR